MNNSGRQDAKKARQQGEGMAWMEPDDLLCSRNTHGEKDRQGVSMLVLCSRNARPEKGLVRRPHLDQHGCPLPGGEKQASLEGSFRRMCSLNARRERRSGCSTESELEKFQCRAVGLILREDTLTRVQKFMTMLENQT